MHRLQVTFLLTVLSAVFLGRNVQAQAPTTTADTYVKPYTADFAYGSNLGYYAGPWGAWDDEALAGIVQAAGGHSLRPFLPEYFLASYGFNVRASNFAHYTNVLGMQETVCAIGEPSPAHRDNTVYGGTTPSKLFANLYEPIWSPDGTVNPNNYYAQYVYQLIQTYGDNVRIWEVVNEPDITNALPAAWSTRAPLPEETVNTMAPIYHYIRTLRITWEVVKRYSPDDYVAPGGLGYPEFLDALLRYTDNPNAGGVSAAYPVRGGAYFDMLSYHTYPAYDLRRWSNAISGFVYERTSDYAATQVILHKDAMQAVLNRYGYDGQTHPKKPLICTETNISRRTPSGIDSWRVGTDEMQRNFFMKTLVLGQKHGIDQLYTFSVGEAMDAPATGTPVNGYEEFHLMGLYENLMRDAPGQQRLTQEGVGFKTTSQLLYGWKYDAARTAALNLPAGVEGAAFSRQGSYAYALWAKALTDLSETSNATYTFPAGWDMTGLVRCEWDFSRTNTSTALTGPSVGLGGSPSFFVSASATVPVGSPPTITAVTPAAGAAVGTSITITGTNFTGATIVRFYGVGAAATFTVTSPTSITAVVPAAAITGKFSVTTPAGVAQSAASFNVLPTISSFTPTSGPPGTLVTITGTGLTGAMTVKFAWVASAYTVVNSTTITATVPVGARTGYVDAATAGGSAVSPGTFTVGTGTVGPTISSFAPTANVSEGTVVTITGTDLSGATAVRFNTTLTSALTVLSNTQVRVAVPAGATTGLVSVVTPTGTASSGAILNISIILPPTNNQNPTVGSFSPLRGAIGSVVRIIGTNLAEATSVEFNGLAAASFTVNSSTQITATVPAGATTGEVSVTADGNTGVSAASFSVTYRAAPTITNFWSASGMPGATVTVIGTNFSGVTNVQVGTVAVASFTVNSPTEITLTIPATAVTAPLFVTTSDGMAQSAAEYTVIRPPTITSFTPTSGPVGSLVTITGTNLTGAWGVKFRWVASAYTVVNSTTITTTVPVGATGGRFHIINAAGVATSTGSFTVTSARAAAPSGTTLAEKSVDAPVSVELHPNPATGWVRIQLAQEPTNATTVKIIDGFGQVLRVVEMSQSVKRLSLAGLKPGIYTVRVGETSKRLIVE